MKIINNQVPIITLIVLIVLGSLLSDHFFTFKNASNMIQFSAEIALISIGMAFVIFTGGIDLSVGSTVAFAAVISANMQHLGVGLVLFLIIIIGGLIGFINGLVITKAKVEPFMATLAMMAIVRALTLWYTNGGPILKSIPASFKQLANDFLGIPLPVVYVIVAFILGYIVLNHTPFGRHVLAVGGGEETSRLFGIKVEKVKISVYIISGTLAALAGALITARIGMGEPRSGYGFELMAIAVVIVGGTNLMGGRGTIGGTFIGLMIITVVMNIMSLLDISSFIQPIVRGLIIILAALAISRMGKTKNVPETS
ncbi:ABC transporter permease [Bacillus sp. V59.32b]|uniref:ABC transporter permease n=1 Tax=Bacillus sp. V59.32b TaxID=1758642 RepID=UPI000E3C5F9E|nr:ribose ABC transporter permease [Bacillus sp. V59.32b]RFU61002.1 ribose ABC transporter permease [Bacillus sp. V59.32b]